jgi:hypothetical protein
VAFIAHHVAEYFQQSPVSLKIRGMTRNDILREAVTDVITTTVHGRQERPFLDRKKVVAALDGLDRDADFGRHLVTDQTLMVALSFAFIHDGLGRST